MPLIVTLLSSPVRPVLTPEIAASAAKSIGASRTDWLADLIACDLVPDPALTAAECNSHVAAALGGAAVDIVVQEADRRRKNLLIADMDSTMIDQECIDELADEVGVKEHVAAITARSMNGEMAFEPALRERVALLAGLDFGVIDRIIANRITLASGGQALVQTMRANGCWTALVSGGFDVFTGPIAAKLGFDENRANHLNTNDGKLVGTVRDPILGREAKATALTEISARLGLTPADAIAVGDGANDLDMIRMAGTGVALHAKPSVAEQARVRIDNGDLTALLYIQGYRRDEFVGSH
ncbi:MAG: phosphoserine phosphatase SerB [Rhizobiaceae bacterium]|nr:phosphoserine phosphatase SerB [Rhizobiaceae bacterium]